MLVKQSLLHSEALREALVSRKSRKDPDATAAKAAEERGALLANKRERQALILLELPEAEAKAALVEADVACAAASYYTAVSALLDAEGLAQTGAFAREIFERRSHRMRELAAAQKRVANGAIRVSLAAHDHVAHRARAEEEAMGEILEAMPLGEEKSVVRERCMRRVLDTGIPCTRCIRYGTPLGLTSVEWSCITQHCWYQIWHSRSLRLLSLLCACVRVCVCVCVC